MKKYVSFSLLLLVSLCFKAQTIEQQVKSLLDSIYNDIPESVGLITHVEAPNYQISYSYAVGLMDTLHKKPLQKDQPGGIASNTKTYTSAAILRLVEKGELELDQAIGELLSSKTKEELKKDGYRLDKITIYHLLSHTSGIADYIDDSYLPFVEKNPKHRWTRDEQIVRTVEVGTKLGEPGELFQYGDINFILLTEIIEQTTQQPFFTAMRELLTYQELGINNTWFLTLEERPSSAKESMVQYYSKYKVNTLDVDPSFDLYGAGGIWATAKDLALFNYALLDERIIVDSDVMELIYRPAKTKDNKSHHYFLGLQEYDLNGTQAYGHGGFWGTIVYYVPDLDVCISIFVLEKNHGILRKIIGEEIINIFLKEED